MPIMMLESGRIYPGYKLTSSLEKVGSTRTQMSGYKLPLPFWVRLNFPGTSLPGYESVKLRVDLIPF